MSDECEECGKVSIISNITLCEDCYKKEITQNKKQGAVSVLEEVMEEIKKRDNAFTFTSSWDYLLDKLKELEEVKRNE
jgi:hypothetical protein